MRGFEDVELGEQYPVAGEHADDLQGMEKSCILGGHNCQDKRDATLDCVLPASSEINCFFPPLTFLEIACYQYKHVGPAS